MTFEDFEAEFRGQMLMWQAEVWAMRHESPSEAGRLFDRHTVEAKALRRRMFNALSREPAKPNVLETVVVSVRYTLPELPKPAPNGAPQPATKARTP